MNDKQLLKTIQNDIKNIEKCLEMCIDEEGIDYLKSIQKDLRKEEIKIVKKIAIKKSPKGVPKMKECTIHLYQKETNKLIDEFIIDYHEISDIHEFIDNVIHDYDTPYYKITYSIDF